ncbi:TPA: hypothetical protein ACHU7O_000612, partial [Streptococcus suis]
FAGSHSHLVFLLLLVNTISKLWHIQSKEQAPEFFYDADHCFYLGVLALIRQLILNENQTRRCICR